MKTDASQTKNRVPSDRKFNAFWRYIKLLQDVKEEYFVNIKFFGWGLSGGGGGGRVSILFDTSYLTIENTVSDHI